MRYLIKVTKTSRKDIVPFGVGFKMTYYVGAVWYEHGNRAMMERHAFHKRENAERKLQLIAKSNDDWDYAAEIIELHSQKCTKAV